MYTLHDRCLLYRCRWFRAQLLPLLGRRLRLAQRFAPPSLRRVPDPELFLHILDIFGPAFLPIYGDQTLGATPTFQSPRNKFGEQTGAFFLREPQRTKGSREGSHGKAKVGKLKVFES